MLQMSAGTALLVDETGIKEGTVLTERGLVNVKALSEMVQSGCVGACHCILYDDPSHLYVSVPNAVVCHHCVRLICD
jgi:hypothetical protein